MPSESQKISLVEKVGYSLGDAGTNFVFQMQIMFLMFFYTDVFGISAATVGTLFLISRFWDAVNDPLMGAVADRTNSRWGKFRPWVLWTAVPFGVMFVLTFSTPQLTMGGKVLWAYVTYIVLMMVYTASNIPYSALMAVLTSDSIERTSLASYRFIFAMLAAFVIQGFVHDMVDLFGEDNRSIVSARVSDGMLQIEERGPGTAKVAVTAADEMGHSVTRNFIVKVIPADSEIPVVAAELADLDLPQGFSRRPIDLQGMFHAPNGPPLVFYATSLHEQVASAHVEGNTLWIEEQGTGMTEIAVEATNRYGNQARERFLLTVGVPDNARPRATRQPRVELDAGFGQTRISLDGTFTDDDGDALEYSIHGADRAVVVATIDGSELVLTETSAGFTQLEISASDGRGGVAVLFLPVVVRTVENMSPALVAPLDAITRREGFGAVSVDLSDAFVDPDGDPIHYSVTVVNQAQGFQRTILIFAVLAVLFFFITFFTTKERVQPDPEQSVSVRQDLSDLFHNGPWVALFVLTIFIFVNLAMRGAITLYYFRYYLGREDLFGLFNGIGLGTTMIGILFSKPLAARFGKRNTFFVCLFLTAVFLFLFLYVPPDAIWAIFLLQVLLQLSYGPTIPLLWAMMADVADYSEWKTGRRATGMTFSAASFGSKVGLGFGGAASGWLLAHYGYLPGVEQSNTALGGIVWMMSVYPAAAFFVGVVVLLFYRIDKNLNVQVQQELAERRQRYAQALEKG